MKLSEISLRYLKGQKKHTVMTILAIITATAFMTVILAAISVYRTTALNICREANGSYHIVFNGLSKSQLITLKSMDIFSECENYSVSSYTSSTSVDYGQMQDQEATMEYLVLGGKPVDDVFIRIKDGGLTMLPESMNSVTVGRLPEKDGEIVLSSESSQLWGFPELGDTVTALLVSCGAGEIGTDIPEGVPEEISSVFHINSAEEISFTVVGFSESTNIVSYSDTRLRSYSYLSDNMLARFSDKTNDLYWDLHHSFADAGLEIDDFSYGLNQELLDREGKGVDAKFSQAVFFGIVYLVVLFIMFCVRMVIDNSFEISAKERIKQFGLLKAVGASKKQVFGLVVWEAVYLAVPGVIIGLLAGTGFASLIFKAVISLPYIHSKAIGYDLGNMLQFDLQPYVFISSAFIGVFWVIVSAVSTGMRSIRSSPVEAMTAAGKQEKISVPKYGSGLENGSFTAAYSGLSIKRNKKRYIITMVSIVMSMVLFSSFSYGAELYRNKISDEFDQNRQPYDYSISYVSIGTDDAAWAVSQMEASGVFDSVIYDSMIQFYQNTSGLDMIEGTEPSGYEGVNFEIHPVDRKTYESCIQAENGMTYDELESSGGVIIDSQMRADKNSKPYTLMNAAPESMTFSAFIRNNVMFIDPVKIPACGTYTTENRMYYSCGNTCRGVMAVSAYESLVTFLGADSNATVVDVDENTKYTVYTRTLLANAGNGMETEAKSFLDRHFYNAYTDNLSERTRSLAILEIVRLIGYFVIAIIAVIAAVNIVNIISSNVLNRTSEFAMLRACGMSDKQLHKLILSESLIYAALATFSSLLIIELAIIVVQIPFKTHFNDLTMDDLGLVFSPVAPLKYIAMAAAAAFIIAAGSSWMPARRIIKSPIVENIRSMEN